MRNARNLLNEFYLFSSLPEVRHDTPSRRVFDLFQHDEEGIPSSVVLNTFWREREGAEEFTEARGQVYKVRLHFILYSIH